jgi:hypothetical protein
VNSVPGHPRRTWHHHRERNAHGHRLQTGPGFRRRCRRTPAALRFRRNWAPANSPETFDGTGQLIAVVADADRADNGDIVAISRPNIARADVEAALDGWETWAELTPDTINLAAIRRRIHAAGLD